MRALVAALAILAATPLAAEDAPPWRAVDAATGQIADVAGLEQLARDFPDSTSVRLRLLNAQLAAGESEGALASLRWLAARGHVFSEAAKAKIPELIGPAHSEAARALLIEVPEVIATSTVFDEIPAMAGLVEGLFVPPGDEGVMVTSVSDQSILVRGPGIDWMEVPIPSAHALSGIASSLDGSIGWIASANTDGSPEDPALFTGLVGLPGDFNALEFIPAPPGVLVSDLATGPDGRVYASDPIGGAITHARRHAAQLEVLVAPGTFRSPQGLAASDDGARLYVSDYRYGLAVLDLASGTVSRLASGVPAALDGVDGLWLHEGELIAVQNGVSPMRISAFTLSQDGTRITGHRVLEQAHPEWTEQLGGSIADGALHYIATGQWDRFDKGKLREGLSPMPTVIRRLPLGTR